MLCSAKCLVLQEELCIKDEEFCIQNDEFCTCLVLAAGVYTARDRVREAEVEDVQAPDRAGGAGRCNPLPSVNPSILLDSFQSSCAWWGLRGVLTRAMSPRAAARDLQSQAMRQRSLYRAIRHGHQ